MKSLNFSHKVYFQKQPGSHFRLLHFLSRLPNLDELEIHTSSAKELFKFERLNILDEAIPLPQITSLKLQNVFNVKHILWRATLFQSLKTLQVTDCGDLINLASSSTSFQNVTNLEVYRCNQLVNLMTASVAKSMVQLENLRVKHCDILMDIVGSENDGIELIVFTKMKTLQLSGLQSLQSFSSGHCAFQFPCLENVVLKRCPNLKKFCAGTPNAPKLYGVQHGRKYERKCYWKSDLNATIQQLYMEMIGFVGLDDVKLSIFPLLKEKWSGQIQFKYFRSLKKLVVDDCCSLLPYAISPHLLRHSEWLEDLKVEKCEALEQVFDLEGLNPYGRGSKKLKKMNQLRLLDLPCLRQVWNKDPHQILSFKNLQLLEVQNCGKLTYVFDLSMTLRLPKRKHVDVKNCSSVKHIIVNAEEETMHECRTIFPSLQSISLQHLTSLSCFFSTTGFLECPSLKIIEVVECPKMALFSLNEQDSCVDVEEREEQISCKGSNSKPIFLRNQFIFSISNKIL